MVWVVNFEVAFGKFFPPGDFVELRERLGAYYATQMPAEAKSIFRQAVGVSHKSWVFQKFSNEIGVMHPMGPMPLTPIEEHEWPRTYQAERPIRSLGAMVSLPNGVLVVEARVKELIEELDPGVHQFRPITFLQPNSEPFPGSYFVLVIGRFLDSFLPEASEPQLWHEVQIEIDGQRVNSGSYSCRAFNEEGSAGLAFSREVINGVHLWRERRVIGSKFYMSDQLHDAINRMKLPMPRTFRVKEI